MPTLYNLCIEGMRHDGGDDDAMLLLQGIKYYKTHKEFIIIHQCQLCASQVSILWLRVMSFPGNERCLW